MSDYKKALREAHSHLVAAHDEIQNANFECGDEESLGDISDVMFDVMEAMDKVKGLYNREEK